MPAWYAGLDLLIHPSFHAEGFPLPPLEAMASGVPVVLTDIPSFRPIPADAVARVRPGDARGTMLFVSHDQTFLRGLANRVLEIAGEDGTGKPVTYGGTYEEYVAKSGHEAPGVHA